MKSVIKKAAAVVGGVVIVLLIVVAYGSFVSDKSEKVPEKLSAEQLSGYSNNEEKVMKKTSADMLDDALNTVVGISSTQDYYYQNKQEQYMGSGVIVSEDGYIITNQHVIGANSIGIEVTLSDGKTKKATEQWSDAALDLAVIKISGSGYGYSKMGDANSLRVGESVMAIGNPLSMQFERTVTAGIVSATGRSIDLENEDGTSYYMEDLIQTDASINPGNSGGPLLDSEGRVVGINTVKVTSAEGMGFAVPVNVCVPIIERLRSKGTFHTPYMGLYAYTPAAARYFGYDNIIEEGLFAAKIDKQGPAASAGIKNGDIIIEINQKKVKTMLDLREELYKFQSGDVVEIKLKRGKSTEKVKVTLANGF